ncbi:amino acid/polyamine transporter I [Pseudomassariella vexata]|uniref:Amino acid/polyamine transporter I n=1 Tax=Pseudomassariella vexata TaxID=1141098 RepID=A0A1Y2DKI8_9PEZI|nr:amino acid/polyamine transporter I [Pseudomassariella vexata]ORY59699.1 amino acid/polyamine transporter I [Pseudomassariella vexata]
MGSLEKKTSAPRTVAPSDIQHGTIEDPSSSHEGHDLSALGYKPELCRNRSMFTLLFQSLAIAAIPYGFGAPLISAIYGGGQLAMFLGWVMVLIVDECVAISLGELASRYPTSAGPYYWSFQVASPRIRTVLSFVTGWTWLVGNWTITLSVNFGFASLVAATVALYYPDFEWQSWHLLLIFYAICLITFVIVAFGNKFLPSVDTFCAVFTALTIFITLICLSAKAESGRNSPSETLGHYDTTLSGWGSFSFLIGTLPSAYTFSAIGMISSMAEECGDPTIKLPKALALCVPVGGIAGLFFIIPICATMPALADILEAPVGQALPYIYLRVMGSPAGACALTVLILVITLFCSISITVAASRCTWAFSRDHAVPASHLWSRIDKRHGTPIWALVLTTGVQMLLGLINLGSSSAFNAFVAVGVIALAVSYGIPITLSMIYGRQGVNGARWTMGPTIGWIVNVIAVAWIAFEVVLFSMPTAIPVTAVSMNYAIVVFVGFMALSAIWYGVHARKVYKGPPASDGLRVS